MNLKKKIQLDVNNAMKAGENEKTAALKLLQSEIKNAEVAKRTKLSKREEEDLEKKSQLEDDEILQVMSREIKKRKDAMEMYEKGGRLELVKKEKKEAEILSVYLPEQMPENEIRNLVKKAIEDTGANSPQEMGKVMAALMPKVKGKADGASVSKVVKELLS